MRVTISPTVLGNGSSAPPESITERVYDAMKDAMAAGGTDGKGKPKLASGFWETAGGFYHAVNWREPLFTYLLAFHAAVLVLAAATRRPVLRARLQGMKGGKTT